MVTLSYQNFCELFIWQKQTLFLPYFPKKTTSVATDATHKSNLITLFVSVQLE